MNQHRSEWSLFVYGSMTQGLVHFQKIADFAVNVETAYIKGDAYQLKVGFPVVLMPQSEAHTDFVQGELVSIKSPDSLVPLLDQFHGFDVNKIEKSLYFREEITTYKKDPLTGDLSSNTTNKAYAYFLNPQKLPKDAQKISDESWKGLVESDNSILNQLTESQKDYILKLGKITGRETIPINLQTYRELMNLDLIVDKGRRLALSKFGHEVYRYIHQ